MRYWTECRAFFREFREQYRNTGSILPSSRSLGRALVAEIRKRPGPARILEIGPGTGPVTTEILRQLRPGDQFDIVEINEHFVALLRERFEKEPLFRRRRDQVRLIHGPLQEVPGAAVYDFMVSGLPLNNFPVALVEEIFQAYQRLLKLGGVLSYFEYVLIRHFKMPFVKGQEKQRLLGVGRLVEEEIRAYQFREEVVFWNVPPAVARHLCFSPPGRQLRNGEQLCSPLTP
jgi:phosphatidylethanolamine/phosphatidyl-N-methylethanolamine N-methyltransferase